MPGCYEVQDELLHPERGTPQGGVLSPLLANVYLHYVLDEWFERDVRPRLKGRALLIRYADDFIIGCELEEDARWLMEVLPKRLGKYGLSLHSEKSRLVRFHRRPKDAPVDPENGVFDFLGFTHYWGQSHVPILWDTGQLGSAEGAIWRSGEDVEELAGAM